VKGVLHFSWPVTIHTRLVGLEPTPYLSYRHMLLVLSYRIFSSLMTCLGEMTLKEGDLMLKGGLNDRKTIKHRANCTPFETHIRGVGIGSLHREVIVQSAGSQVRSRLGNQFSSFHLRVPCRCGIDGHLKPVIFSRDSRIFVRWR
jgi:hypothetical protein